MGMKTFNLADLSEIEVGLHTESTNIDAAISETSDTVKTETSENSDNTENEEAEKTYKTVATTSVVTVIAYMLGMEEDTLESRYGENNNEILESCKVSKEASIIRYLCRLRTSLMMHFKKVDDDIKYNFGNIDRMEYFKKDEINKLIKWEVPVILTNTRADKYSEHFNKLIADNIEACRTFFPDWLNYEYIKDVFVVPKYWKSGVLKQEFEKYMANINRYPFHMYMHWQPGDYGNILSSDGKFISLIYVQHKDTFVDKTKFHDAAEDTKQNIYEYIDAAKKVKFFVDCENCDVYKLAGVLRNLDKDELAKVDGMVLYDDVHTTCAWDILSKFTHIPVEHVEVERVMDTKSLVDIRMAMGISKAYYEEHVDSFVLCSSDSDFWAVISSLPEARFIVLYEYEKCSHTIKDMLNMHNIYHCAIDDFYTGNANDIKKVVLRKELEKRLPEIVGTNAQALLEQVYWSAKVEANKNEKKMFFDKYIKTLRLKINDDGVFFVDMTE